MAYCEVKGGECDHLEAELHSGSQPLRILISRCVDGFKTIETEGSSAECGLEHFAIVEADNSNVPDTSRLDAVRGSSEARTELHDVVQQGSTGAGDEVMRQVGGGWNA
ncbi:MAG: hypothetical protein AAB624_01605 [Patescibacteria group bacterium]